VERERGVNIYFKVRGWESVERAATLRLYSDFASFFLFCDSCNEASARGALGVVADGLRPAVE